jgi:outer membrane immunogenic protein
MQKLFLLAALLTFSGSAFAADMAVKAPPASVVAPFSWGGLYIGGNVGGVIERASGTSDYLQPFIPAVLNVNPQSDTLHNAAVIGGPEIGYNWQLDPRWVVGVEGDIDFTHAGYNFCRQTDVLSAACFDNGRGFETVSSTTDWLATARGRVGMTWSNFLIYATGGAAWGAVKTNLAQSCLVGGCGSSGLALAVSNSSETTKSGWVGGFGAEINLAGNWSAKLEWLHIDLGNITNTLTSTGVPAGNTGTTVWSRDQRYDVIRFGIDYRLWKS